MVAQVDRGAVAVRYCPSCGAELPDRVRHDALYCSSACRARHWRWAQRSRSRICAMRGEGQLRARCAECDSTWVVGLEHRAGTIYCSHRCRTRAWRRCRSL